MKDNSRYTLAIEEPIAGLAEHSSPIIVECLRRGIFHVLMFSSRLEIEEIKNFHQNMGITRGVTYLTFEELDYNKLKIDAILTCHTNSPGPLFKDLHSPTNIPRIAKTHTLTDKNTTFPAYGQNFHPMAQFNVYFASGPAAFRGSWEEYVKLHPSTLKTIKIFEIGSPRTDVLVNGTYNPKEELINLGLNPAKKTIIYAPTFQKEASLEQFGLSIIDIVRVMDVNLLIRLHHMSLALNDLSAQNRGHDGKDWRLIMKRIERDNHNVRFIEGDSNPYFVAADLLIGDVSGACYEFVLQNKPVIFIDAPNFFVEHGTRGISYWGRICGDIVSDMDELGKVIQLNLEDPTHKELERKTLINELVFNPGNATEVAVNTIIGLINGSIPYPKMGCRLLRMIYADQLLLSKIIRKAISAWHSVIRHE